jgi:hypothetical protein
MNSRIVDGKVTLDPDAIEEIGMRIHHLASAAYLLGKSLGVEDRRHAHTAFSIEDGLDNIRAELYALIGHDIRAELQESMEQARKQVAAEIAAFKAN